MNYMLIIKHFTIEKITEQKIIQIFGFGSNKINFEFIQIS